MRLEDLHPNSTVHGVHPDGLVIVVNVEWFGSAALEHVRRLDVPEGLFHEIPPHRIPPPPANDPYSAGATLGGQRSPRLKVTAAKGRMRTGASSCAVAISTHSPSRSSKASRVRSAGSTNHR